MYPPLCRWINKMLVTRIIHSKIGNSDISRSVDRETPQGGVISPLLWLLVVNNILMRLEHLHITAVAYADDVVIMCSGFDGDTKSRRVKLGLKNCKHQTEAIEPGQISWSHP
ncbi:reverse transcriptase domain-containing protein [Streptomyces sp. IBSBF 2390]|uniref:reverse transcriptase domain-containing protein n=1 Tax=Streptomyces sp. IBSBF 2390 TaxID=2903533 RepID=UPI003FA6B692